MAFDLRRPFEVECAHGLRFEVSVVAVSERTLLLQ